MKKLKDQQFRDYTIKIDRVRSVKTISRYSKEYTDKMFLVDIKYICGGIGFAVPITKHYGKSLKRLFKKIQEALHL